MTCKHLIDSSTCYYCNGGFDKAVNHKNRIQQEDEAVLQLRKLYSTLKCQYKGFGDLWNEEEYRIIYHNFEGISRHSNLFKKTVYKTAMQLERTTKAVMWHHLHIFIKRNDKKAGKGLLAFVKANNII